MNQTNKIKSYVSVVKTSFKQKRQFILPMVLVTVSAILFIIACVSFGVERDYEIINQALSMTTQDLKEVRVKNTFNNRLYLLNRLNHMKESDKVLLKRVEVAPDDPGNLIIEPVYDSQVLADYFDRYGIHDVETFNKFIETTDFEPTPVCYSPVDLFESRKGNCNAYALFTMFFLDRYKLVDDYEVIVTHNTDEKSHIYLKLKGQKQDEICDLTKEKRLILPV